MTVISDEAREHARSAMTPRHWSRLTFHAGMGQGRWGTTHDHKDACDNHLIVAGYVQPHLTEAIGGFHLPSDRLVVTPAGREALAMRSVAIAIAKRPHEDIIGSLADHFRDRILWRSIELADTAMLKAIRPDLLTVSGALDPRRWEPSIFEVKASRADALFDLRSQKFRGYLPHCERLYFAAPDGVLAPTDLPAEVGLYLRDADGRWRCARPARKRAEWTLPPRMLMKLIVHLARGEQAIPNEDTDPDGNAPTG